MLYPVMPRMIWHMFNGSCVVAHVVLLERTKLPGW